jgi:DNA-binding LytR/AlgR family response regulator
MPDGADPAFPAGVRGLRVLVVDDEAPALEELGYLLRRDHRVADVRTAGSADEALAALRGEAADAVFLDIRMPGTDGLTLAHLIGQMIDPPRVVFISAYDDHAVDAFGLQAADYLLKPVDPGRLAEAVRRVATKPRDTGPEGETIPVELGGVTRFVNRSDVRYVEAQGDYARLHTADGSHLVRVPLTTLEERWREAGFLRVHRSLLVSVEHIDEMRLESGRCAVRVGDAMLTVSRRHTRELRDLLVRRARPQRRPT